MQHPYRTILAALLALAPVAAQPSTDTPPRYDIPPSEGAVLELTVANASAYPLRDVEVAAADLPSWLMAEAASGPIALLEPGAEAIVRVALRVALRMRPEAAAVAEPALVRFDVQSADGPVGQKRLELAPAAPSAYALGASYPNPFNPSTAITYALPQAEHVRLVVYDAAGREVARLVDGPMPAGRHRVRFEAGHLASGLYVYRLQAGSYHATRTAVLVR